MNQSASREHVHIVILSPTASQASELLSVATSLVSQLNVHIVTHASDSDLPVNQIVEPSPRGGSPAIAFAGCKIYRDDPTAVMLLVDASQPNAGQMMTNNFGGILDAVEAPGALVTLQKDGTPTGIYAWSIYAIMESFRNYCPVDFPIIDEIAKTWGRDEQHTRELYDKLTFDSIEGRVLQKVRPGYPTRNVSVQALDSMASKVAPIRGDGVSEGAILPDES